MTTRTVVALVAVLALAGCGHAPPAPVPKPATPYADDLEIRAAADAITPAAVLARLSVIADDSMEGRNTPSVGLEKTAHYLAANYQRWGLQPAGDSGTWFQRYTIERVRPAAAASFLQLRQGTTTTTLRFDQWATATGPMTGQPISAPAKLIGGTATSADIAALNLAGFIVFFVQQPERATINAQIVRAIAQQHPLVIVNVVATDAAAFQARVATAMREGNPRPIVAGVAATGPLVITAHDTLFAGDLNRPDFRALREAHHPVVMNVPSAITVTAQATEEVVSTGSAPNVVAVVEGNDSLLKHEYVIFSAHMDHIGRAGDGVGGCIAKGTDSICNGADDDGSGTTGVMSIAEAVARLKGRTHRSIVILNVSGEEKGLLGSAYFAAHPTVPLAQVVADINMDMIGRNNPDSIVVIGKEHSDLGATLAGVQASHPELHLTAADDIWPAENFYSRSDHFNFARMGVPVLFFFNGVHPQYHQPDDEISLIDTSKISRVAQLAFYLGVTIADTPIRPKWNPASYQQIVVEQRAP